jgi:hypothetical protein
MDTKKVCGLTVLMLEVAFIVFQVSSLETTPVGDSGCWWGDESWLMSEYREQVTTGVLRHPNAFGASVHTSNGVLFGSMWASSIIYGVPSILASSADMVVLGRIITTLLALALCVLLWLVLCRKFGWSIAALGVALLVSSTCYFLTSHSARYDILTSLAVFAIVFALSKQNGISARPFAAGSLLALTPLVTLHVSFILAPVALLLAFEFVRTKHLKGLAAFVSPFIFVAGILLVYHWATTGITLFGSSGLSGFSQNYHLIPISHPFSRSVLVASVLQKAETAWASAPVVLVSFILAIIVLAVRMVRRRKPSRLTTLGLLAVFGYLMLETSRLSYLIYVLPLLVMIAMIEIGRHAINWRITPYAALAATIVVLFFAVQEQASATRNGNLITQGNVGATQTALARIVRESVGSPKVLCSRSSIRLALQFKGITPITTHFMEFGDASDTTIFQAISPDYVMVWASANPGFFVDQESRLRWLGSHYGHIALAIPAIGFDLSRDYFAKPDPRPDTLLVYRIGQP